MIAAIKNKCLKYFDCVTRVLSPKFPLFFALLLIQSIQLFISYSLIDHLGPSLIVGTIAWAFILSLPPQFIASRIWRGVYLVVILTISSMLAIIELFCALQLKEVVTPMHIGLIAGTNYNESTEFLSSYLDIKFAIVILGFAILITGVYQLMRRVRSTGLGMVVSVVSVCSLVLSSYSGLWKVCGVGVVLDSIKEFFVLTDYDFYQSQPKFEVCETSSVHPNIILVIGESFDKNHSSLYGYTKETNPLLAKRLMDSSLVVFKFVKSPAPNTDLATRQMLSLSERYDDDFWYEKPILMTALAKGGYDTRWISNQSAKSVYNFFMQELAALCDSVIYTCDYSCAEYLTSRTTFDDVLFLPLEEYVSGKDRKERKFCVVKLMGSHARFDLRYPDGFARFVEADYGDQPKSRRKTFVEYDNSILYNDYVVDSMMKIADKEEAILLYTSDHGLDFFYTRDIAAHGSVGDPDSFDAGCHIPFMLFFTKQFRKNHPNIVDYARSMASKEFNTKYLMNTIMDIAGYDICDSTILHNSLFEGRFCQVSSVEGYE